MGEGKALQHVAHPGRHLIGRRMRMCGAPLGHGDAARARHRDERPVVLHADLGHRREAGMVQARGHTRVAHPVLEGRSIGGLDARQRQHHLFVRLRIEREPDHRAGALAEQLAQGKAPEAADRVRAGGGRCVGRHRDDGRVARLDRVLMSADARMNRVIAVQIEALLREASRHGPRPRRSDQGSISMNSPRPVMNAQRTGAPGWTCCTASR